MTLSKVSLRRLASEAKAQGEEKAISILAEPLNSDLACHLFWVFAEDGAIILLRL